MAGHSFRGINRQIFDINAYRMANRLYLSLKENWYSITGGSCFKIGMKIKAGY
jgi:hypothetical protein